MSIQPPVGVFDLHLSFQQAPEFEGAEVDVPDAVLDLLEADVFADAGGGDIDPRLVPANAAVGADITHFEAMGYSSGGSRLGIGRGEG
jgi:hypothetical protein